MTAEELNAIEELISTAIAWARPVVELRDKEAKDAQEAGDDSYSRLYRAVPSVVYRKRPGYEHDPSLLGRPEGVSEGDGGDLGEDGGIRGTGDGMAEPDEGGSSAEDDSEKVDFIEVLRQVGVPILPATPRVHSSDSGEDDSSSDS